MEQLQQRITFLEKQLREEIECNEHLKEQLEEAQENHANNPHGALTTPRVVIQYGELQQQCKSLQAQVESLTKELSSKSAEVNLLRSMHEKLLVSLVGAKSEEERDSAVDSVLVVSGSVPSKKKYFNEIGVNTERATYDVLGSHPCDVPFFDLPLSFELVKKGVDLEAGDDVTDDDIDLARDYYMQAIIVAQQNKGMATPPQPDISLATTTVATAWRNLGASLHEGEVTSFPGFPRVDRTLCFAKSLEYNPTDAWTWGQLGVTLDTAWHNVKVQSRYYSKQQCYMNSIELDSNSGGVWYNLATTLPSGAEAVGLVLVGQWVNRIDCFCRALVLDDRQVKAWIALGDELRSLPNFPQLATAKVCGKQVTAQQCYLHALELSPNDPVAWYGVGMTLVSGQRVVVRGKPRSLLQCFQKALECGGTGDDDDGVCMIPDSWLQLSEHIPQGQYVTIGGQTYTADDCREKYHSFL